MAAVATSTTCRWATTSRPGWVTRWSTGSSSLCSVGCMPVRRGPCRCAPACPSCSRRCGGESRSRRRERLLAAASAVRPADGVPHPSSPGWTAVSAGWPRCSPSSCACRGVMIRSGTIARELHREPDGAAAAGRSSSGRGPSPSESSADAVVLAVPGDAGRPPARPALPVGRPRAGGDRVRLDGHRDPRGRLTAAARSAARCAGSGFLVPPVEGRTIKASTFTSTKWGWAAEAGRGPVVPARLGRPARRDLRPAAPRRRARRASRSPRSARRSATSCRAIVDTHVQRWGGALPQYAVGHLDRVARIRAAIAGLAGAGAGRRGIRRGGDPGLHRQRARRRAGGGDPPARRARAARENERHDRQAFALPDPRDQRLHPLRDVVGVRRDRAAGRRPRGDGQGGRGRSSRGSRPRASSRAGSTTSAGCAPRPTSWSGGTPSGSRTSRRAYRALLRTELGQLLEPTWSAAALHRPAEFNKSHIPAFLADEQPKDFICVYPFVRSYEWYLLDDKERRDMLREHGQHGARLPRRAGQHDRRRSRWTTTSGCWPSRPTSCTASST